MNFDDVKIYKSKEFGKLCNVTIIMNEHSEVDIPETLYFDGNIILHEEDYKVVKKQ